MTRCRCGRPIPVTAPSDTHVRTAVIEYTCRGCARDMLVAFHAGELAAIAPAVSTFRSSSDELAMRFYAGQCFDRRPDDLSVGMLARWIDRHRWWATRVPDGVVRWAYRMRHTIPPPLLPKV